jgi:hypothetical protein
LGLPPIALPVHELAAYYDEKGYSGTVDFLCAAISHFLSIPFPEELPWSKFITQVEKLSILNETKVLPVQLKFEKI